MTRTIAIALLCIAGSSSAETFSSADLAALDKQQSWQELFSHLGDIPPAKRDASWQSFLDHASVGVLKSLTGASEGATFADSVTRQYPRIKSNKEFMALRADVGIRGLDECVSERGDEAGKCAEAFVAFVDADPTNLDLAWRAGESLTRAVPSAAVPFFKRALAKKTTTQCSADALKMAITAGLSLAPKDPRVADAQVIGGTVCWDGLKDTLVERFTTGTSDYRRNVCGFMRAKKDVLSGLAIRQCDALKAP